MAHILVVDDDALIRELIQGFLAPQGHTFAEAENGIEAVAKIRKTRFDLIIIDRNMPQMDGIQTVKSLKSIPAAAGIKILMCTSANIMAEVQEAFNAGVTDYIVKPMDGDRLLAKVASLTKRT
jgi:two-component system chemotaxis response regulator CheY